MEKKRLVIVAGAAAAACVIVIAIGFSVTKMSKSSKKTNNVVTETTVAENSVLIDAEADTNTALNETVNAEDLPSNILEENTDVLAETDGYFYDNFMASENEDDSNEDDSEIVVDKEGNKHLNGYRLIVKPDDAYVPTYVPEANPDIYVDAEETETTEAVETSESEETTEAEAVKPRKRR